MATGTFPKKNPGVDNDPDFHSGDDALASNLKGFVKRIVSTTATHTTVEYIAKPLDVVDYLWSAKADQLLAATPGNLSNEQRDKALQWIVKIMRGIAADLE